MSLQAKTQETREIRPRHKFEGHTDWITGIIHLPGRQRTMTCSFDGSLRVWNSQSGKQIGNDWRNGEGGVTTIALSPDGTKVVCGTSDSKVLLWNIDTEQVIWMGQHAECLKCVCWNRDGGRVVSGSSDGTARVWDVESGKTVLKIETGLSDVQAMICSPDTTMVAIGGYSYTTNSDEFLNIWDANTGKLITHLKGHIGHVHCLAWTADGKTLISGSIDCSIRMWNKTTWQQINVLTGHTSLVHSIALSPNGRILASASWDKTARLWNLENGHPIGTPLQHPALAGCVSFSMDGKLLVTGASGDNAYSWDIAPTAREAGLDELLLSPNDGDKSLLNADATRHPRQRRDVHRIPQRFFDDSPRLPHPSPRNHPSPSSTHQHHVAGPSKPRFLAWARHPFSVSPRRQNDEGIELQGHPQAVVDVPFTRGQPRNVSAAEVRRKQEKAEAAKIAKKAKEKELSRNAKNARNASAGSSQLPQGSLTQQSGGAAQTQPSLEQVVIPASSTIPSTGTARYTLFKFWPAACCTSAQHTDGHH